MSVGKESGLVRIHNRSLGIVDRLWIAAPAAAAGPTASRRLIEALRDEFSLKG